MYDSMIEAWYPDSWRLEKNKWFVYQVGLIENFGELLVQFAPVILQSKQND